MSDDAKTDYLPNSPYPGIEPFSYAARNILFAREKEARALNRLIVMYRGVLLYSGSGTGKSSLVNAGLVPFALKEGFQPERIRIQPKKGEEFVIERIAERVDNKPPFIPSVFTSDGKQVRVVLSVKEFLKILHRKTTVRPLLIFDQFEEWITLFEERSLGQKTEGIRVVQNNILEAIVSLINEVKLPVKILISLREDYLAKLVPFFKRCPDLPDNYLRLTFLKSNQVYDVIRGPFEKYPGRFRSEITSSLAKKIQMEFEERSRGGDIQLTEVQIVCQSLFETKKEGRELEKHFTKKKGVKGILEQYLERSLRSLSVEQRDPAIGLLSRMVTSAGTRNVISSDDLLSRVEHEDEIRRELLVKTLNNLEKETKLIRRQRRREVYYYEIVSEFLIEWIRRKAQERQRLADQRKLEEAERNAEEERRLKEKHLRTANRLKLLTSALIVMFVLAVGFGLHAGRQRSLAISAKKEAYLQAAKADWRTFLAEIEVARSKRKEWYARKSAEKYKQQKVEHSDDLARVAPLIGDKKVRREMREKAISLDPKSAKAQRLLEQMSQEQDKYDKSIEAFSEENIIDPGEKTYAELEKAYESTGEDYEAAKKYYDLGEKYRAEGEYSKAIEAFQEAIKIEPTSWTYAQIGRLYELNEDYDQAIANLEKAISLDPEYNWAYQELGLVYEDKGKYGKAIEAFQKANNIEPNSWTYAHLGGAYRLNREYYQAIENLEKAIALDFQYAWAYREIGLTYRDKGEYNKAIEAFQEAIKIEPTAWTYAQIGWAYDQNGNYNQAISNLEKAVSLNPQDEWAYQELGFIYQNKGHYYKSIEAFREAIKIKPTQWAYAGLGIVYHEYKFEYKLAYDCYKKALEISPDNLNIKANFIEANLTTCRFKEAYRLAQELLEEPDTSMTLGLWVRLNIKFFMLASLVLQEDSNNVGKRLEEFIDYYKRVLGDYEPGWEYKGTRNFIEQREMDKNQKKLLLKLIDILETPTPDITIEEFKSLL